MEYQMMRLRPDGEIVRVYSITGDMATIWCESQFIKADQGWKQVRVTKLVPMDYDLHNTDTLSKTQQQKAKKRLHLEDAVWRTSDGLLFSHSHIDEAVEHELNLIEAEKKELVVPELMDNNTNQE